MTTPQLHHRLGHDLAVRFTDERSDIVIKAADEFRGKPTAPNQLWQTDFTCLKVVGWGWYYLSTVLDEPKDRVATSCAASWRGSCAPRCRPVTSPLHSIWRWTRRGSIRRG